MTSRLLLGGKIFFQSTNEKCNVHDHGEEEVDEEILLSSGLEDGR